MLGYSKRITERLTAHTAAATDGTFLSVRFGNVLSSRGSVVTAFQAQIDAGLPITVTHPEVTRYLMTVQEAVQLVLQAAAIGRDGEALVLDMGDPVRIDDIARQLAAQAPGAVADRLHRPAARRETARGPDRHRRDGPPSAAPAHLARGACRRSTRSRPARWTRSTIRAG